ncbi:hypothetical protein C8R43DRAFT_1141268 [Mycena crocata]|nr:hypothetical protein C8R43DRAFT_1141268 [Mycena crocata]
MSSKRGAARGRGRGGSRGRSKSTPTGAGTKRTASVAAADSDSDFQESSAPKKSKAALPPRPPAALREKGNKDPAGPDKPRTKRPNGSIAEDAANAEAAAEEREAKRLRRIERIAALDAEREVLEAEEAEEAIDHLRDLPQDDMDLDADEGADNEPVLTITQDDFDRIEDDEEYRSTSEFEKPKTKAPLKPKKPAKRQTRAEIATATEVLVAKRKGEELAVKKKGVQNSDAAAASRKAGISGTWLKQRPAITPTATAPKAPEARDGPALGGLTDDDADAVRPAFESEPQAPRKNDMISFVSTSDIEETPSKPGELATVATTKPTQKRHVRVPTKPETSKIPALSVSRGIKSELSSSSFTPDSSHDVNGLPAFIAPTWPFFLSMCYRAIFLSADPMVIGAIGTDPRNPGKETVAFLQAILDHEYRGNGWKIVWRDAICTKAVKRIGERRSAVGKAVVVSVDRLVKGPSFFTDFNSPTPCIALTDKIKDFAWYALQKDGPGFYKTPTPEEISKLRLDRKDAAYIKPKGYLESPIIIETLSQFITGDDFKLVVTEDREGKPMVHESSVLPIGLLGMTAAAVERAYRLYATGVRVEKVADFSLTNIGTAVAGYIVGIKGLFPSRWESILGACGAKITEHAAEDEVQIIESLDGVREGMYVPSSP